MSKDSHKTLSEFSIIKKIQKSVPQAGIIKSIGDDCAVIKEGRNYYLFTIDNMVDQVHFDMDLGMKYDEVGFKAVVRSISDVIAMGGAPIYLLVSLLIPVGFKEEYIDLVLKGVKKAGKIYNLFVIGGDISASNFLTVTVASIGVMKEKPIFRAGARFGDNIYYTGNVGYARAGLELLKKGLRDKRYSEFLKAFLTPTLRVNFARELARNKIATSMIDISDGFLGDLKHILDESKVGCVLKYESFLRSGFDKLTGIFTEKEIDNFIFNGGDDYELIFTAPPSNEKKLLEIAKKLNVPFMKVGHITDKGFYLLKESKKMEIVSESYEHII